MLVVFQFLCIFAPEIIGALAHLARALDWQSKGDEFESRMLHNPIKVLGYAKDSFFRIAYFVFLFIFVQVI